MHSTDFKESTFEGVLDQIKSDWTFFLFAKANSSSSSPDFSSRLSMFVGTVQQMCSSDWYHQLELLLLADDYRSSMANVKHSS